MKKVLFFIVLAAATLTVGFFFRREILAGISFLYSRPYRDLSDKELDDRISSVEIKLGAISENYEALPGNVHDRSLDQHATARDLVVHSQDVINEWRALEAEKAWRKTRSGLMPYAGLWIAAIVFLETGRRMMNDRDPRQRRRQAARRNLDREVKKDREDKAAAQRAETVGAVDPRLARLVPGTSSRRDVVALLGQPQERTVFLEFEAWIYRLSPPGQGAAAGKAAAKAPARPIASGPGHASTNTVTILFSGDLIHDISIGTISEQNDVGRIL